jgi:hypothetical protein
VSITDQRKLIILQHDWLDLAHVRTRRNYVRLRPGRNNCRSSIDRFCCAQSMKPRLWTPRKREEIRHELRSVARPPPFPFGRIQDSGKR